MVNIGNAIKALFVTVKVLVNNGLNYKTKWDEIATEVKSNSSGNIYSWLGKFPMLRKWVGDRQLVSMKNSEYTLANQLFEATVPVSRSDIEDDSLGMYRPMFEQMGQSGNEHVDLQSFGTLADGFTKNCYDGKPYFAADHPVYPNVDGTGTVASQSNIVNPAVTTGDGWFLIDASKPIKPIIYQNREPAVLQEITDQNNDSVFMKDQVLFGVRARRAFGYSIPQLAVGSRDTLNAANFQAACQMLMSMKVDGNRPLGCQATTLVVPPSLQSAAEQIVEAQFLANGSSNLNYHKAKIVCSPYAIPGNTVEAAAETASTTEETTQG